MMIGSLLTAAFASADALILRDGRRVEGELISVQNGVIEFQTRGPFGFERARISRSDVVRIDLESFDRDGDRDQNRDRDRDREVREERQPPSNERPAGLREREVIVDARRPWTDTGIELRNGQTVYFAASGRVHWGPGREDGPEGEHNSPHNPARPIPGRPGAALIGRVADNKDYFYIGDDKGPIRVRSNGRLYLGVNDDNLADNSGNFRVTVYY
jgi:hypothetical protein